MKKDKEGHKYSISAQPGGSSDGSSEELVNPEWMEENGKVPKLLKKLEKGKQ